MLTMQRSTLSFAAIIIFAVIVAIFVVRKGIDAADELERLDNGAFAVHRTLLAQELDSDDRVPDISNWKIYQNEKYGFEIKYPEGHTLYSSLEQDRLIPVTISSDSVAISVDETQAICCESTSLVIQVGNVTGRELQNPRLQRTGFNNLNVLLLIGEGNLGSVYKILYLKSPSGVWVKIIQNAQSDLLDQILSTFKFIK